MFDLFTNSQVIGFVFFGAIGALSVGTIVYHEFDKKRTMNKPQARRNKR